MSAVCPTCGVAVVPGYVKCPKCHAKLPSFGSGRIRVVEGGTSVPERGFPVLAIVVPVLLVAAIVAYFGFIRSSGEPAKPAGTDLAAPGPNPTPTPTTNPTADPDVTPTPPPAPSLEAVTTDLQRALQRQRLWSTIEIVGSRVDIRSTACSETAMGPSVDAAREALRRAGATQLRCLPPAGGVVFQRDL